MKELVTEIDVRPIRHITISDGAITETEEGIQVPVYDWKEYEGEVETVITEEAQAQRMIAGMVRRGDLTDEQWADVIGIYPAWGDYADGTYLKDRLLLTHNNQLYMVIDGKAHNKQSDWAPGVAESLFVRVTPAGIIDAWVQPQGAHDAYNIGHKVTHDNPNDGGTIWVYESAINANTTEPGRDGTFDRWWTPVERV